MIAALIDEVMPVFDVRSFHATRVAAPPDLVYETVRRGRLGGSRVIDVLMNLRSLPSRLGRRRSAREDDDELTIDAVIRGGFTLVAERPGDAFVLGIAGRFWTPVPETVEVGAPGFAAFSDERFAKAAWSFSVTPDAGGSVLATETRVLCPTPRTRSRFLWYWRLIAPFSGVIRTELLKGVRRSAELAAAAPVRP